MQNEYLTLAEAARACPKPVHASAIWRWVRKGIRTKTDRVIRLRAIEQGKRILTTREWLLRFFEEQLAENNKAFTAGDASDLSCELSATDRAAAADAQLEAAGL